MGSTMLHHPEKPHHLGKFFLEKTVFHPHLKQADLRNPTGFPGFFSPKPSGWPFFKCCKKKSKP